MSFRQANTSSTLSNALGDFLYTTAATSYSRSLGRCINNPVPSAPPVHAIRTVCDIVSNIGHMPPTHPATANASGSGVMGETDLESRDYCNSSLTSEPSLSMKYAAGADGTWPMGTSANTYSSNICSKSQWTNSSATTVYDSDMAQEGSLKFELYTGPVNGVQDKGTLLESPHKSVSSKGITRKKSISRNGGSQKKRSHRKTRANKRSQKSGSDRRPIPPSNASKPRKRVEPPKRGAAPVLNADGTYKYQFTTNLSGDCIKHARTPRLRGDVMDFDEGEK